MWEDRSYLNHLSPVHGQRDELVYRSPDGNCQFQIHTDNLGRIQPKYLQNCWTSIRDTTSAHCLYQKLWVYHSKTHSRHHEVNCTYRVSYCTHPYYHWSCIITSLCLANWLSRYDWSTNTLLFSLSPWLELTLESRHLPKIGLPNLRIPSSTESQTLTTITIP